MTTTKPAGRLGTKLKDLLDEWWQTRVRPTIRTALPAFVTGYDHTSRTATVQPTIKQRWSDGRPLNDAPPLSGRPVVQVTRGGGWVITHGLEEGDQVLVIACDRALDSWQPSPGDETVAPSLRRYHDLSDTVVVPGLAAAGGTPTVGEAGELYLGADDGKVKIRLGADGSIAVEGAKGSVVIGAAGGIVVTPGAGAKVQLGGVAATLGVARLSDPVAASASWTTFASQVAGYINALIPGTVTVPGPQVGTISGASGDVDAT